VKQRDAATERGVKSFVLRRFACRIWAFGILCRATRSPRAEKGAEGEEGSELAPFLRVSVVISRSRDGEDKPLRIRSRCTRASDLLRIVRAGITTCNWIMKAAIVINVASFLRLAGPLLAVSVSCIFNSCF